MTTFWIIVLIVLFISLCLAVLKVIQLSAKLDATDNIIHKQYQNYVELSSQYKAKINALIDEVHKEHATNMRLNNLVSDLQTELSKHKF